MLWFGPKAGSASRRVPHRFRTVPRTSRSTTAATLTSPALIVLGSHRSRLGRPLASSSRTGQRPTYMQ